MGELDFVIEQAGEILPIEVKSGKNYEKHSALYNVIEVLEYGIKGAYIFTNDNIREKGKLTYLPIYMVMFMKGEEVEFAHIDRVY